MPEATNGRPLTDAARLERSFSLIYQLVEDAVRCSLEFFPRPAVGFGATQQPNPYVFVKDLSADQVVVGCWESADLFRSSYAIADDSTVTFGAPEMVVEKFAPVAGDEMTDAIALTDEEVEILDDGAAGSPRRLRILSSKANTRINKRIYPMNLVRPAVAKLRTKAKMGQVFAEFPHPKPIRQGKKVVGYATNDKNRVSRIVSVEINDRGEVWTEHEFFNTSKATEIFDSFRNRTGEYGISQRAIGELEVRQLANGPEPVAKTFNLDTYDFVKNPALTESISNFEVFLDSELGDFEPPVEFPPPPAATAANLEEELSQMPNPIPGASPTSPAAVNSATNTPAPVAAAALTPEHVSTLEEARRVIEQNRQREKAETDRRDAEAYLASDDVTQAIAGFPEPIQVSIRQRLADAPTRAEAELRLANEVDHTSRITAIANLAAQGFSQPGAGTGQTTSDPASPGTPTVVSNPTPHLEVVSRIIQAHDEHDWKNNARRPDEALRAYNKKNLIDVVLPGWEQGQGRALLDGAEALLDSSNETGWDVALTDSTTTSNMWNQPVLAMAIIMLRYQDLVMAQYCGGIGPEGFSNEPINGQMGSVLRIPTEIWVPPAGSLDLPGFDTFLFSAENAGVATGSVQTSWQAFFPSWMKIAIEVTKEAEKAMKNGPADYDLLVRSIFNAVAEMRRRYDSRIAAEMIQIGDEYGAKAVANESVAAGNLVQNTGANLIYGPASGSPIGAAVTYYANLIGGGTQAVPARPPIVRQRVKGDLNAAGQFSTSTLYTVTVTGAATTQVQGYLESDGSIGSLPNTTATFAVDYNNGRIAFAGTSNVDGGNLPTASYTYATNYDVFSLAVPAGMENAKYYNLLLEQVDRTAAYMGSTPRFNRPNLCLGSEVAMTRVENAQLFYKQASPDGTRLLPKSQSAIATRNNIDYAKTNTPWAVGDGRLLLHKVGATRVGVDTPLEVEGPYSTQDLSTGNVKTNKTVIASENSLVCTPQAVDQNGATRNPVSRSIVFR